MSGSVLFYSHNFQELDDRAIMEQFCPQFYCQVPVQPENYMLILPHDIDVEFILEFYTDPDSFRYSYTSKFIPA
jgi:hypothetical protein